jgi:hypothetical protein
LPETFFRNLNTQGYHGSLRFTETNLHILKVRKLRSTFFKIKTKSFSDQINHPAQVFGEILSSVGQGYLPSSSGTQLLEGTFKQVWHVTLWTGSEVMLFRSETYRCPTGSTPPETLLICMSCITLHKALTSLRACKAKLIRAPCPGIQTLHLGGGRAVCMLLAAPSSALWGWFGDVGSEDFPRERKYWLGVSHLPSVSSWTNHFVL